MRGIAAARPPRRSRRGLWGIVALVAATGGCGDGTTDPTMPLTARPSPESVHGSLGDAAASHTNLARVVVGPSGAVLTALGDTVRLTALEFDDSGHPLADADFTWSSSATRVATVDTTGTRHGCRRGSCDHRGSGGLRRQRGSGLKRDRSWSTPQPLRARIARR